MKTKNMALSLLLFIGLNGTGCTNGFDAINTNPFEPTDDMYDFSKSDLGAVLKNGAVYEHGGGAADLHQRVKALGYDVFSQYTIGSFPTTGYTPVDGFNDLYWKTHYNNWLSVLNLVIRDAEEYGSRENSLALARIWRVFLQSRFVDYFGPAPFPKSPEDENPPYESLKEQFDFFFVELDEAVKQFDPYGDFLTVQDQIYWGNINKWKRFANTLRLRLAMQVSEIDPALSKTQAQAAFDADGGIMLPGEDARVAMEPPGAWGKQYPYYMYQVAWGDKQYMTSSMGKILTNIGGMPYAYVDKSGNPVMDGKATITPSAPPLVDPRGTRMFDPSAKSGGYKWQGLLPGPTSISEAEKGSTSGMSQIWLIPNDQRKTDIFLYPEACFLAAEATLRFGVNSGKTAKTWYEEGVKASFTTWELSIVDAINYLSSTEKNLWGTSANFDDNTGAGNTALEKIITQKYIAGYPDISAQAWNDKRRLNLPTFDIHQTRDGGAGTYPGNNNIQDPKNYIQRMTYPQGEKLINEKNYDAGVAQLTGGDKTSSSLWWATGSNYCTSTN